MRWVMQKAKQQLTQRKASKLMSSEFFPASFYCFLFAPPSKFTFFEYKKINSSAHHHLFSANKSWSIENTRFLSHISPQKILLQSQKLFHHIRNCPLWSAWETFFFANWWGLCPTFRIPSNINCFISKSSHGYKITVVFLLKNQDINSTHLEAKCSFTK